MQVLAAAVSAQISSALPASSNAAVRVFADASRPDVLEVMHVKFSGSAMSGQIIRYRPGRCETVASVMEPLSGIRYANNVRFTAPHGAFAMFKDDAMRFSEPGSRGAHIFVPVDKHVVPGLVARFRKRQYTLSQSIRYRTAQAEREAKCY